MCFHTYVASRRQNTYLYDTSSLTCKKLGKYGYVRKFQSMHFFEHEKLAPFFTLYGVALCSSIPYRVSMTSVSIGHDDMTIIYRSIIICKSHKWLINLLSVEMNCDTLFPTTIDYKPCHSSFMGQQNLSWQVQVLFGSVSDPSWSFWCVVQVNVIFFNLAYSYMIYNSRLSNYLDAFRWQLVKRWQQVENSLYTMLDFVCLITIMAFTKCVTKMPEVQSWSTLYGTNCDIFALLYCQIGHSILFSKWHHTVVYLY